MDRKERKDFRRVSPAAQDEIREKAVKAYLSGKTTQNEIAKLFEITARSLRKWVRQFRHGGMRRLKARTRGRRPGGGKLNRREQAQIVRLLKGHTPDGLGLPYVLWSRQAVQALIEGRRGKRLSIRTVGRYLRQWGFTPKRTVRKAYEQNPQEVKQWLEKDYPQIQREAKAAGASIYWSDQMGMRSHSSVGLSYSERGEPAVVPGTGKRFRCTMLSVISNHGELLFMVITVSFTGKVFISFLRRLIQHAQRKIYLIVDQHPVHRRAKAVARWVEEHRDQIRVIFLPGYSPELNPVEYLNQDVKANASGRLRPHTLAELLGNLRSYLYRRQRQPQVVSHYFQAPPVRYASEGMH